MGGAEEGTVGGAETETHARVQRETFFAGKSFIDSRKICVPFRAVLSFFTFCPVAYLSERSVCIDNTRGRTAVL